MTSYRGGLAAAERRRIERQLYDGTLRAVTATSTLELGVDIALLEAVIILGFPGSVAKLWQRAGRCGPDAHADLPPSTTPSTLHPPPHPPPSTLHPPPSRCGRDAHADALCVVVAYPSAIDQWVMRHPARLLARPLEACSKLVSRRSVERYHALSLARSQFRDAGAPNPHALTF
jgi:ATP-dependent helicase YprA (DUF1998 family)